MGRCGVQTALLPSGAARPGVNGPRRRRNTKVIASFSESRDLVGLRKSFIAMHMLSHMLYVLKGELFPGTPSQKANQTR